MSNLEQSKTTSPDSAPANTDPAAKVIHRYEDLCNRLNALSMKLGDGEAVQEDAGKASGQYGVKVKEINKVWDSFVAKNPSAVGSFDQKVDSMKEDCKSAYKQLSAALEKDKASVKGDLETILGKSLPVTLDTTQKAFWVVIFNIQEATRALKELRRQVTEEGRAENGNVGTKLETVYNAVKEYSSKAVKLGYYAGKLDPKGVSENNKARRDAMNEWKVQMTDMGRTLRSKIEEITKRVGQIDPEFFNEEGGVAFFETIDIHAGALRVYKDILDGTVDVQRLNLSGVRQYIQRAMEERLAAESQGQLKGHNAVTLLQVLEGLPENITGVIEEIKQIQGIKQRAIKVWKYDHQTLEEFQAAYEVWETTR